MTEDFNFDINDMAKNFCEMCQQNDPETIEYYEEIKQFRAYGTVKDFRNMIDTAFNDLCFNNSLVHKINYGLLNDNQKLYYNIISYAFENNHNKLNNLTNKIILKYYMEHLNEDMKNIKLEDLGKLCNYWYDNIPSRYLKRNGVIDDTNCETIKDIKPNFELVKYTTDFLKIGNALLFNVEGFPKNQINLLLYGIAVYYAWINMPSFKTFKELVNYLKSFIQINTYSKCLDVLSYKQSLQSKQEDKNEGNYYNLITYLSFKNKTYNYRYKTAEKYFKNRELKKDGKTKFEAKADGESYIYTEYQNKEELMKAWDELEEEFKDNGISNKLINMWFDGQLLTRSTCLIGCMLIMLKEKHLIKFNKDEMPDWKSIALNTFEGTYETSKEELKDLNIGKGLQPEDTIHIKLVDVLYLMYNFMENIKQNFN